MIRVIRPHPVLPFLELVTIIQVAVPSIINYFSYSFLARIIKVRRERKKQRSPARTITQPTEWIFAHRLRFYGASLGILVGIDTDHFVAILTA